MPMTQSTSSPSLGLTVIPCSALPKQLLHRPGGSGGGMDFKFADHPSLSRGKSMLVELSRRMTNEGLLSDMRVELGGFAGAEGLRMVTHFADGTGSTLKHLVSSPIGKKAVTAPSFIAMRNAAEANLTGQLSTMATSGTIDCNALVLPSPALPWLSFTLLDDGPMLKAIIGGTQGHTVWLTGLSINPAQRNYTMELRYVIRDDFGVDSSDLYSPGLIAFWVLQHERRGFRPFVNLIDLTVTRSGIF